MRWPPNSVSTWRNSVRMMTKKLTTTVPGPIIVVFAMLFVAYGSNVVELENGRFDVRLCVSN